MVGRETGNKPLFLGLFIHQNKEYRVKLKTRQCNVTSVSKPFPFPTQTRYDTEVNVGPVNMVNEHVTVTVYDGKSPSGGEENCYTFDSLNN